MAGSLISILSIAGSDSCGGAGIQADIKAAARCGVYAATVVTAVTAQSTAAVKKIIPISPDDIILQLEAVLDDFTPDAVKIGMIGSTESGRAIASFIKSSLGGIPVVVDPVLASTSRCSFGSGKDSMTDFYTSTLLPLADVATPNIPEASSLLKCRLEITNLAQQQEAAMQLMELCGCKAVVVKGGHSAGNDVTDLLAYRDSGNALSYESFRSPRIECSNLHGTGCTFSTLLACGLAKGMPVSDAFLAASKTTKEIISESLGYRFGNASNGALNTSGFLIH